MRLILDTDIGTDVDDAWALLLCLGLRDVELQGVTLVYGDLDIRAGIALKLLHLAGRDDIPVCRGSGRPMSKDVDIYWPGHEGTLTDFSDIRHLNARDDGVGFILDTLRTYPHEVTLCSIGPVTNLAGALLRSPETLSLASRLVVMASSYEGDGPNWAVREHNSTADPAATRALVESRFPITLVGLNVTRRVSVSRAELAALDRNPLGRYLAAMTRQYMDILARDYAYMHDPLAVTAAVNAGLVDTRRMRAEVLADGRIALFPDPGGWIDVCTDVRPGAFHSMLMEGIDRVLI